MKNHVKESSFSDDLKRLGYINEKKEIIAKACEWLESAIKPYMGYGATSDFVDTFRKAMEE